MTVLLAAFGGIVLMSAPASAALLGHEMGTVTASAGTEITEGGADDAVNGSLLNISTMQHENEVLGAGMFLSNWTGSAHLDNHPAGKLYSKYVPANPGTKCYGNPGVYYPDIYIYWCWHINN